MLADWPRASTAGQQRLTSKNTTRVFFEFSESRVIKYPAIPMCPVAISPRKHPSGSAAGKGALRHGAQRAQSAEPENDAHDAAPPRESSNPSCCSSIKM